MLILRAKIKLSFLCCVIFFSDITLLHQTLTRPERPSITEAPCCANVVKAVFGEIQFTEYDNNAGHQISAQSDFLQNRCFRKDDHAPRGEDGRSKSLTEVIKLYKAHTRVYKFELNIILQIKKYIYR